MPRSSGTRSKARAASMMAARSTGSSHRSARSASRKAGPSMLTRVRDGQACRTKFRAELMRPVGVPGPRCRSQGRQPAGPFHLRGELEELRMIQIQSLTHCHDPCNPARDRGHEYRAAGPHDPPCFGERASPVSALTEMVERAEQEHRIDRGVVEIQVARVAHRGMETLESRGLVAELLGRGAASDHDALPRTRVSQASAHTGPGPPPMSATTAGGAGR